MQNARSPKRNSHKVDGRADERLDGRVDGRLDGQAGAAPTPFFVLRDNPCPYLPGRRERKLLTRIDGPGATDLYGLLSRAGFRRSHVFAYRPACDGCSACVPVRVAAEAFRPSRGQRRVLALNGDLIRRDRPAVAGAEDFELFHRYILDRHGDGEMATMDFAEYRAMVDDSRLETRLHEARTPDGALVAVCLADWLEDGASAVYSFFDPRHSRRSLGTWMVLALIEEARRRSLPFVYLGYWIDGAPKMSYKARFRPLEGFGAEGWRAIHS